MGGTQKGEDDNFSRAGQSPERDDGKNKEEDRNSRLEEVDEDLKETIQSFLAHEEQIKKLINRIGGGDSRFNKDPVKLEDSNQDDGDKAGSKPGTAASKKSTSSRASAASKSQPADDKSQAGESQANEPSSPSKPDDKSDSASQPDNSNQPTDKKQSEKAPSKPGSRAGPKDSEPQSIVSVINKPGITRLFIEDLVVFKDKVDDILG